VDAGLKEFYCIAYLDPKIAMKGICCWISL